jgi:hypothetical protein
MSNAWKYGDYDTAFQLIALAGQDPIVNTLEIVLVSADNYIESALLEVGLPIPDPTQPWPNSIIESATNYAIANTLRSANDYDENKNMKVSDYMDLCDKFLQSYITVQSLNAKNEDLNPYSSNKSPSFTLYPLKFRNRINKLGDPRDDIENLDLEGD